MKIKNVSVVGAILFAIAFLLLLVLISSISEKWATERYRKINKHLTSEFNMNPHNIGFAVQALKSGKRVTRPGWNGKGMYLVYMPQTVNTGILPESGAVVLAHVVMKTVDGTYVPWLCSQTDLLATDWSIYGEEN